MQSLSLEEAMGLNPIGFFQYRLFVMCGLNLMTDGFEITLLSFLTVCAGADWSLTNVEKATLTGMVFLGIVLGSLFFGWFADKYGRRPAFLYSCLLITVGGFLSAVAPSYSYLVLFRTMTGIGIGGSSVPFDLLAEFLPESHRGSFLAATELFWAFGSMAVAAIAWGTLNSLGWRFLTFACAVPVFVTLFFSYMYLPESPRWLMTQHREREANLILRQAAALNGVRLPEFVITSDASSSKEIHEGSYLDLVRTKEARRVTFPIWAIWGLFGFSYYGLVLFQSRIFSNQDSLSEEGSEGTCKFDYGPIFYNSASEFFAVLFCASLIDRMGRVWSQSLFYIIAGVGVIMMGYNLSFGVVLFFSILARMGAMSASVRLPSCVSPGFESYLVYRF